MTPASPAPPMVSKPLAIPAPRACHPVAQPAILSAARDATAPLPVVSQLVVPALIFFVAGASLATALQYLFLGDTPIYASKNALGIAERSLLVTTIVGSGLGACALPAIYLLWRRSREAVRNVARVARIVSPAMLAFALPLFFNWKVFRSHELLCVLSATLFGLCLERALRLSYGSIHWESLRAWMVALRLAYPRTTRWLPRLAVLGLVVSFGAYFSYYTVLHYYRLQSQSWDLAIFDNMMWNLARGKWFKASPDLGRTGSHIQYHATFSAYLLVPFYALRQKADTLLVLQSVICGAGAIPLYLIVKRRLASAWAGVAFAFAYAIYAPLHGPIFYDFHFLTLAPFWVGWVLYFFETRRRGWLVFFWILALFLREDQGAALSMACLFYLVSGERTRWALFGGLLSAAYFVVIKFGVMPAHRSGDMEKETFTWLFAGLIPEGERGFGAVLRTMFSNPLFTLDSLLVKDKFIYVMKLLAPVLFLPLRNSRAWLLILVPAMFTLLTTGYRPTVQTTFQYSANWTAYVFFATAVTLSAWRGLPMARVRIASAVTAILLTGLVLSYNYGAIFQHNTFRGGFRRVVFEKSDQDRTKQADLYSLIAMIPPHVSVAATETEAPHVSNREDCFTMRFGHDDADYLLVSIDEARSGNSKKHMEKALATGQYGFVATRGRFALWGKGVPKDRNAEGAKLIGIVEK